MARSRTFGFDINNRPANGRVTFGALVEHFRHNELTKTSGIGVRALESIETSQSLLENWILPRWRETTASDIKPLSIEAWFETLTSQACGKRRAPLKWTTVTKLKSVMCQVFKHAQRHELIPTAVTADGRPTNPVLLARTGSGKRYEAKVVLPEQMVVILKELDKPDTRLEWTAALVHAATALRPEEAFGLKWQDIDWHGGKIHIRRGWSKGRATEGKTEGSMTQVAMHPILAHALHAWRCESVYARDSDWVFASNRSKGKRPRSAGIAGQDYLRPAAVKAAVIPEGFRGRFGWHNLRHSFGTFLAGEFELPLIQGMLRHSKPTTTAIYMHRVNSVQMAAQEKFLDAIKLRWNSVLG